MILPSIYVGRNRNGNRKESEFFFTDSDSKPWIPITLLLSKQENKQKVPIFFFVIRIWNIEFSGQW